MYLKVVIFFSLITLFSCDNAAQKVTSTEAVSREAHYISQEDLLPPVAATSHLPRLIVQDSLLHMSWVEERDSLAILKYASYDNHKWTTPQIVSSGTNWFVNWADFPALGINGAYRLTNILKKSAKGTYDYDIKLQLYKGNTLIKNDFSLNTDGVAAEHGFVSIAAYNYGFSVSWLDGRNTKNSDKSRNQMSLRNAFIDFKGNITSDTEIDARVCDCCNTATAVTKNGPIAVYRDRSGNEPETRNTAIVRRVDGEWSAPKQIGTEHWELNGCPVNGPGVDAIGNKMVVAWFTAQGDDPRVLTAFSSDSGATFSKPTRLDQGNAIGRIATTLLEDHSALVSWLEPLGDQVVLQIARVYKDGSHDLPMTIVRTSAARQSGFPQLEVLGDTVFVAWTDVDGDRSEVKVSSFVLQ